MLNDKPDSKKDKTSSSELDISVGGKFGVAEADAKISYTTSVSKVKIKRGGFKVVPLEGGSCTAFIRRLWDGTVRFAILDNFTGKTVELGEL